MAFGWRVWVIVADIILTARFVQPATQGGELGLGAAHALAPPGRLITARSRPSPGTTIRRLLAVIPPIVRCEPREQRAMSSSHSGPSVRMTCRRVQHQRLSGTSPIV